jgi:hypothetical protein
MSKAVSRMAGVVLEWGRAAFIVLMVGFPGVGHADDRVAATDLRVERHPRQAGTYMGIMKIKNIGSTAWSNIPYQFADNGQPIVFQIEGRSTTTPTDVRTVLPQQEITVSQSFPLYPVSPSGWSSSQSAWYPPHDDGCGSCRQVYQAECQRA